MLKNIGAKIFSWEAILLPTYYGGGYSMIRLMDILEALRDKEERSVWRTYSNRWAGRNTLSQVRYFKDREDAAKFARGEIKGPVPGRPNPQQKPERAEKVQKYDVTPPTLRDREATQ
jgi:hypothetical protein